MQIWGMPIARLPFNIVVREKEEIWRAGDFWTKEPETVAWIDSFVPDSVFWDIGANIGVFSLYAQVKKCHPFAFEPCTENFDRARLNFFLNANVADGEAPNNASLMRLAFGDTVGKATFSVPHAGAGRSGGQIGEPVDELGRKFTPADAYEVEVTTIDDMARQLGVPNYIKIDVDGQELSIIRGGINTLCNHELKSVLVEVNGKKAVENIERIMEASGFTSFNQFNGADINRRAVKAQRNVIYTRVLQ